MKKYYFNEYYEASDSESISFLGGMYDLQRRIMDDPSMTTEMKNKVCTHIGNQVRELFNLPDKLFTIVTTEDGDKLGLILIMCDKQPDGKYYPVYRDEDGEMYIVADEDLNNKSLE